ncbi:MAG: DUF2584 family protein, partial [Candidatus Diapherotrites archaeon]|nr:DUF2584 family protein [Candidatus Diapherotrites archaeon]
ITLINYHINMGFKTEFNWALKLKPENGLNEKVLKVGEIYEFSKEEYRVYPVNIPIDLINQNWEPVAKIIIVEFKNSGGRTSGKYKVLKIYEGEEKRILTNYWIETVQIIKGRKISDFSNVKVS